MSDKVSGFGCQDLGAALGLHWNSGPFNLLINKILCASVCSVRDNVVPPSQLVSKANLTALIPMKPGLSEDLEIAVFV